MSKQSNSGPGRRISASGSAALARRAVNRPLGQRILDNWQLYALLLIPVVLTVVYKYIPMYGIQIAFRDFDPTWASWRANGWAWTGSSGSSAPPPASG